MNKMIISILLIVGLVGMIGTASADPYDLAIWNTAGTGPISNPFSLQPGDTIVLSLHMEEMVNDSDTFPIKPAVVTAISGGANAADVTVTYTTGTLSPSGVDPYTQTGEVTISLNSTAPVGAKYHISIFASGSNPIDVGLASRNLNSIPEFPTIALPIATVLGLMFIISSRKKKE